jgi:hypothetical protein
VLGKAGLSHRDAARYSWIVAPSNAEQIDYVLAVKQGEIVGVFEPKEWKEAKKENFPDISDAHGNWMHQEWRPGRWKLGFHGDEAAAEIKSLYLGKSVSRELRGKVFVTPGPWEAPNSIPMSRKIGETCGMPGCRDFRGLGAPRTNRHYENVGVLDLNQTFFAIQIPTKAAPQPLFGCGDQSAGHGVSVDIPQLLDPFLFGPNIKIVKPRLPEVIRATIGIRDVPALTLSRSRALADFARRANHGT